MIWSLAFAKIPPHVWLIMLLFIWGIRIIRPNKWEVELAIKNLDSIAKKRTKANNFFRTWEYKARGTAIHPTPDLVEKFRQDLGNLYNEVFS